MRGDGRASVFTDLSPLSQRATCERRAPGRETTAVRQERAPQTPRPPRSVLPRSDTGHGSGVQCSPHGSAVQCMRLSRPSVVTRGARHVGVPPALAPTPELSFGLMPPAPASLALSARPPSAPPIEAIAASWSSPSPKTRGNSAIAFANPTGWPTSRRRGHASQAPGAREGAVSGEDRCFG
jgi:hypothetical protein